MTSDLRDQLQSTLGAAYGVIGELGGGGMARVFIADALATGQRVAVKVLAPDLAVGVSVERFRREIQVALKLKHPSIVPVISVGQSDGIIYYTMPFIEGESLRALLVRERQLAFGQAIGITRDVAAALAYANGENIVHRDIKPENILIDSSGRAVVTDFGIARAIEKSADLSSLTSTGLTLGTPLYMSPEQAVGDQFVDGRSDIYALACVLYEMLVGEPPFTGPNAQAIIARHLHEAPRPLRIVRPDIGQGVQAAIEKALAKTPAERFHTATGFAEALEAAPNATPVIAPAHRDRRVRPIFALVAGVALMALGVTIPRVVAKFRKTPPAVVRHDPGRIAVLDFEDQSPDRSLGHLASGLAVSLIRELGTAPAIRVVSRNTVRTFRERGLAFDSLVAVLGVGSVVEGSVERSNDRIRVNVSLVDPTTHSSVASAPIERQAGELFMLEDDLAREVAGLLRRRIGVEVRVRETVAGTRSARARDLVFRAGKLREDAESRLVSTDTLELRAATEMLLEADSLLVAATAADRRWRLPGIERGVVALDLAKQVSGVRRLDAFRRAHAQADLALAREPENAAALELRGSTLYWEAARLNLDDRDFRSRLERARDALEHAVRIDSSLAAAWGTLSLVRVARGELAQADRDARTALAMDTYLRDAPRILLVLYGANLVRGTMDDAWRWCDRAGREYPADDRFIQCRLALLAEDDRRAPDPREAWALVAKANTMDPPARANVTGRPWLPIYREMMAAAVTARAGNADSARAVARAARARIGDDPELSTDLQYEEAYLHLVLGERADALRLLAEYLRARPSLKSLVAQHARWRRLHGDSTFARLVRGATPGRT